MGKSLKKNQVNSGLDYEKIINTPEFKNLVKRKRIFSTPYIIFFLLPILHYLSSQDIQPSLRIALSVG